MRLRGQKGQTLTLSAGIIAVLVGFLAVAADYGIEQDHYNRIDYASYLGAKAAADQIDVAAFARTHQPSLLPGPAVDACQRVARANAPWLRPQDIQCVVNGDLAEATLTDHGQLVIQLLGRSFSVKASHLANGVYGGAKPCTATPCS